MPSSIFSQSLNAEEMGKGELYLSSINVLEQAFPKPCRTISFLCPSVTLRESALCAVAPREKTWPADSNVGGESSAKNVRLISEHIYTNKLGVVTHRMWRVQTGKAERARLQPVPAACHKAVA